MIRLFYCLLTGIVVTVNVYAQDTPPAPKKPLGIFSMGSVQSFPPGKLYRWWGYGRGMYYNANVKLSDRSWYIGFDYSHSRHHTKSSRIDYMSEDSIPVKADLEIKNLSDVFNFYLRREFVLKNKPAILPYIEAGGGFTLFKTSVRVSSQREETVTSTAPGQDQDFCVPYDEEQDPQTYTTTQTVRETYELYDMLRYNTWHVWIGGGCHFGIFPFSYTDEHGKFYEEPRGIFLNIGFGWLTGGGISYMNINATHPQESHTGHTASHAKADTYSIPFINLKTQAVHEHEVAYIYTSPLNMLQLRIGLSVKF